MKKADLIDCSKQFARRCVRLSMAMPENSLGRHIRNQLIRCSTSVAANYRAVCVAQSRADFVSKIARVIEETDESAFWIEFAMDERLVKGNRVHPLLDEAKELVAIFVASQQTARAKLRK
ncbi:MAG: four helix bundle protein [Phycisphaerae bacterium]|nr:four helix bundle protein [Phycisphaerae bacterium]